MRTITERLAIAAALMAMASPGFAQSTTPGGAFQSLSPGNQKIARSLFLAQEPTANSPAPLNLNQIAALKEKEGWGRVFQQMKADGLVQGKNLGEVVSSYEHHLHNSVATASSHSVTLTTGTGRTFTAGHTHADTGTGEHIASEGGEHSHGGDDGAITVSTAGGATVAGGARAGAGTEMGGGSGGSHGAGFAHGR